MIQKMIGLTLRVVGLTAVMCVESVIGLPIITFYMLQIMLHKKNTRASFSNFFMVLLSILGAVLFRTSLISAAAIVVGGSLLTAFIIKTRIGVNKTWIVIIAALLQSLALSFVAGIVWVDRVYVYAVAVLFSLIWFAGTKQLGRNHRSYSDGSP